MVKRKGYSTVFAMIIIFLVSSALFSSHIIFISNTKNEAKLNYEKVLSVYNNQSTADLVALRFIDEIHNLTVIAPKTPLINNIYGYSEFDIEDFEVNFYDLDLKVLDVNIICDLSNVANILNFETNDIIYLEDIYLDILIEKTWYEYKISGFYYKIEHKYDEMTAILKNDKAILERESK
ncbi:MAG: hypothetical protein R3Y09_03625 [Clostridia bacterium]